MAAKWRHGNINSLQRGVVSIRDVKLNAAFAERQPHPEGAGFSANETEMIAFNKVKNGDTTLMLDIRIARDQRRIIQRNMHNTVRRSGFAGGFIALVGRVSHFCLNWQGVGLAGWKWSGHARAIPLHRPDAWHRDQFRPAKRRHNAPANCVS